MMDDENLKQRLIEMRYHKCSEAPNVAKALCQSAHLLGDWRLEQREALGDAVDDLLGALGVLEAPDHCLADAGLRGGDLAQGVLQVVARAIRQRPPRLLRQILLLQAMIYSYYKIFVVPWKCVD